MERHNMGYHDIIGNEAARMLDFVETGTTDRAPETMAVPAAA